MNQNRSPLSSLFLKKAILLLWNVDYEKKELQNSL